MNRDEARQILALYRPGTADANDEAFVEALGLCDTDPALKNWFDQHCRVYQALRARFRQVPVPEGLKEQILSERRVRTMPLWRRPAVLVAVAALAVLSGLLVLRLPPREDTSYPVYRSRMTQLARTGYAMDLATNDLTQIRQFLASRGAPADYQLPKALEQATPTGCTILTWLGAKVSMICFTTGKATGPNPSSDLWLFVSQRGAIAHGPVSPAPAFVDVNGATSANWVAGDTVYTLVIEGDETRLKKYL